MVLYVFFGVVFLWVVLGLFSMILVIGVVMLWFDVLDDIVIVIGVGIVMFLLFGKGCG